MATAKSICTSRAEPFVSLSGRRHSAVLLASDPFLLARRARVVELAADHSVAAIHTLREYVKASDLVSYGASVANAYRDAGV